MAKLSEGQNIIDLAVQETGSVEGLISLVKRNGLSVNSRMNAGDEYEVNEDDVSDEQTKRYFDQRNIRINTGEKPAPFVFRFSSAATRMQIHFNGQGTGKISWGDGFLEEFTLPVTLSHDYLAVADRTVAVGFSAPSTVTNIDLKNNKIETAPSLAGFPNLREIDLSGNIMEEAEVGRFIQELLSGKDNIEVNLMGMLPPASIGPVLQDLSVNKNVLVFVFRLEAVLKVS
jgi:hypothetical protein